MRVTHRMMADTATRYMDENLQRLASLQEKVSTGKDFQRPSDKPVAAAAAIGLRSSLETVKNYQEAAANTDGWMSAIDHALYQMTEVANRSLQTAMDNLSDTNGENRTNAASVIEAALQQVIDIANSKHADKYLFSGFRVQTQPFAPNPPANPAAVGYNGDAGLIVHQLGPDLPVQVSIDSNATFQPLFQGLIQVRDALAANDPVTYQADMTAAIDALRASIDTLSNERSKNGARLNQVTLVQDQLTHTNQLLSTMLTNKEGANMAEAITELKLQENTYQTVIEVSSRALAITGLFELMR